MLAFEGIIKDFKNIDPYTLIEQSPDRDTLMEDSLECYKKSIRSYPLHKNPVFSFCAKTNHRSARISNK